MDTEIDESIDEADIRFDARSYSSRLNSMIRSETESILGASPDYTFSFRVDSAIASPLRSLASREHSATRSETESILGASPVHEGAAAEEVRQIRDVAHKAADVVDTYVANIAKSDMVLHQVNSDIKKIRSVLNEIYENSIGEGEFRSEEAAAEAESLLKRRREVEEEDVVGLVHDSSHVIQELMESESRLKVVSIIGMGGLGKTTLARKIYNNNQVQLWFPCLAWVSVSNDYRPKEFLISLLKCSMSSTSEFKKLSEEELKKKVTEWLKLSEAELKKKVAEWLKGKKYLVVLEREEVSGPAMLNLK